MLRHLFISLAFVVASSLLQAQTSLDTAVNFTVKDVNGITYHLNELLEQGKIVVVDFFTITCGACTTYAPMISDSYKHFGCNTSNVVFLGINWGADNAGVTDFGITNGVDYPEISGTEGNGNHVVADYQVLSYPTVILITPDAYIAEKYIWPPTTTHLDSIIASYGGIASNCYTPVLPSSKVTSVKNKILSVFPNPGSSVATCITSVTSISSLEIRSLTGHEAMNHATVLPGEITHINIGKLSQGFYMLLLRNKDGIIIDKKQLIVQRN
ncbi:MAG: TlpA disulfide reductase family protein [Bacteroidota bacterium]